MQQRMRRAWTRACMGIERADRRPLVLGRPWLLLLGPCDVNVIEKIAARFATPLIHWVALLDLCAAYLQGGIVKAINFNDAIAEMEYFSLAPAAPFAIAVIP